MLRTLSSKLLDAIETAKKSSNRNFVQSIDLIVNVKDVDLSKPENRFTETIELPHGLGKKRRKICVIASGDLALRAGRIPLVDRVLGKEDLEALVGNKRMAKKLAREYDYFLVDPSMMGIAAKALGAALGAKGKAPVPIPPGTELEKFVEKYSRSVTVRLRKGPTLSCMIGTEDMDSGALAENAEAVISRIVEKLEKRFRNVASIYVKKTMGEPVKVEIEEK
ncbi:MAG: 50S ribosomal protein L1 [Thaumarchaeota archaeon]|nr:50S ribosomal protein L1 [Candidatus Terraquivivens yellowstonensis]MCL7387743.1 50S ribosomal protein L1 [Candidatus Terraquivivens yellowstonensis]MCL7392741.1 50S ribosomal protein L1 [Candidatus Terraquivivens yellowstonensis]MCL7395176.1 50S ribosomal protein L1 [Candidatus Terraquivivens yellowstonensis]MCL7398404.1 50S ribosomal protein L1 [Candidatus Terraquivivens yellowstonensis]